MWTVIEAIAIVLGVFFMLVSSIGLIRMPDFYSRIHAPTKAATFGLFFLLLAVVIGVPEPVVLTKAVLALVFIAATAPVGAHIMARAAYRTDVAPGPETIIDEYAPVAAARQRREKHTGSPDVEGQPPGL